MSGTPTNETFVLALTLGGNAAVPAEATTGGGGHCPWYNFVGVGGR